MFDFVKNRYNKKLFAVIDYPRSVEKFPAVLILHGFKGWSAQRHLQSISDALVDSGFLTVRPDLTKNPGRSYREIADITYGREVQDTEDVLDYLLNLEEVDSNRVGICGHSLGGMVAAEIASKRKEIKALVTLSAVYSFKLIAEKIFKKPYERAKKDFNAKGYTMVWSADLEKHIKIKKSFLEDIIRRSAGDFANKIKCPTQIISSGNDESVSQVHADKYLNNIDAKEKKLEIIKGSNHNYSGKALGKVKEIAACWFLKTLH